MRLRYLTAGESHGKRLTGVLEGIPSGLGVSKADIDFELARRQQGYGRGDRMKIERDVVEILSGVRNGVSTGSPITLSIENRDWPNWEQIMSPYPEVCRTGAREVKTPRPGHADLTGGLKYNTRDLRDILERASARETAVRVAIGAVCKAFLKCFGIEIAGRVIEVAGIGGRDEISYTKETLEIIENSPLRMYDKSAEARIIKTIDQAKKDGESLGGIFEIAVLGPPVGLGSHTQWDRKLDARLAMAVMSIQAIKGVEFGAGFDAARNPGSRVHDEIVYSDRKFSRKTNRAGGIEGGISNGCDIIIRAAMKPIATLYTPLETVDIDTKEIKKASVERSDICAVPAAAVVAEAVTAAEIAAAFLEKFGGDSIGEITGNYNAYMRQIESY